MARERQITALPSVLKGAALIVPKGLLSIRAPATRQGAPLGFSDDSNTRAEVERLAMEAVIAAERALGNEPRDVSTEKKHWDIESRDPRAGHLRFIEVKGRHGEARDVIITKNEILAALNAPDAFILAVVPIVAGFAHPPAYVRRFAQREPGFAETAVVFNIKDLMSFAMPPS